MNDAAQNTNQSAVSSKQGAEGASSATGLTSDTMTLAPELGPNGLPVSPPQGEAPAEVDTDFILNTMFGDGTAEPPTNSGEGQTQGSNSSDGQSQSGSLAPPSAAPAANGEEGSPQSGPSSTQQQSGQQQATGADETTTQTPGQESQTSPESPPASALSAEDRLRLASAAALEEQNRTLLARLRAFEQGQQPQQQPDGTGQQQPSTTQPAGGQEPPLRLVVPDPLFDMINSEDRAQSMQGMSLLITAVAQNAVNAAIQRVQPIIDQKLAALTQQQQAGEKSQQMENAYFERFPTHKNELFRPLIQEVVAAKFQAFPHAQWDEDMMNAVGATVNQRLQALGIDPSTMQSGGQAQSQQGQAQPQAQKQGGKQPPRQQPAPMLDGGTRTSNQVPQNDGDFISSTFG